MRKNNYAVIFAKHLGTSLFWMVIINLRMHHLKFCIPTAWGCYRWSAHKDKFKVLINQSDGFSRYCIGSIISGRVQDLVTQMSPLTPRVTQRSQLATKAKINFKLIWFYITWWIDIRKPEISFVCGDIANWIKIFETEVFQNNILILTMTLSG